jgi:phytoene dehydrogenase-like protein
MPTPQLLIIGGGLAGLATGCYARANGFPTTIIEQNGVLGGVCTAWQRGPYLVDGCIHWLTGGPFENAYHELGILPAVRLRTLEHWITYRDVRQGTAIAITRDLDALARDLVRIGTEDWPEICRIMEGAKRFTELKPPVDRPPELMSFREGMHAVWDMRDALGTLAHFRKPIATWAREHLHSERLRRFFECLVPPGSPALVMLMELGYLHRGWLSRPEGGTAAFRDALIGRYNELGGEARTHATVDEIVVGDGRACGVRLADGTMIEAGVVVSTASTPETILRLLGGRYAAEEMRRRLEHWKLFDPIVLASFGVEMPLAGAPGLMLIDGIEPFAVGGTQNDSLYVRVCNDDPCFAPHGHAVVQTMLKTNYDWWATRGTRYAEAKAAVAEIALAQLEREFPGLRDAVGVTDVATPLTYWHMARSWRGAYEGWAPSADSFFSHVRKTLPDLSAFYMAGQWVEPGGGVPTAINSGRQVVQLLCADTGRGFTARGK